MCRILIFGGTTEGRKLAEFCAENKLSAYVSVATEYGAALVENSEYLNVLIGRLNFNEMTDFIENNSIKLVIDATHPYAVEVTENIQKACRNTSVQYVRLLRESDPVCESGKYFQDIGLLVDYLNTTSGKILITTGSKELKIFCNVNNYYERCVVRVLPTENVIEECVSIGFSKNNIIAQKGPFTEEQNIEHIKHFNAQFLVTKESGSTGGFDSKVSASEKCGAELLIIKRPNEQGISLKDAEEFLLTEKFYE